MADFTMCFPCSVGDTVYTVDETKLKIKPKTVVEISWKKTLMAGTLAGVFTLITVVVE